jgi:ABC-type transport system involved in cytochrome c biogenesis permease subunit
LATWTLYTLLFHLRARRGWRGKRIAALSIVGFGMIMFTFLGVGWLARVVGLQSLHLY